MQHEIGLYIVCLTDRALSCNGGRTQEKVTSVTERFKVKGEVVPMLNF
jgi:hypothetical protein